MIQKAERTAKITVVSESCLKISRKNEGTVYGSSDRDHDERECGAKIQVL
jgi:hypothetical protein